MCLLASKDYLSRTMTTRATIVVPAYQEALNLEPLITQVFDALRDQGLDSSTELIVVDDNSNDGSKEVVEKLASGGGYPCRIIVRTKERGLSSAVLRGFDEARGEVLLCMDADLQHPPVKVPELIKALEDAEFVIGTRYGKGCTIDENWPLHRRVISSTARLMARPLTPLSDPMTGFFGIQKDKYKRAKNVSPIGFKIAMELYVKAGIQKHAEVPFMFGVRTEGESKLTGAVIVHYLLHLKDLYLYQMPVLFIGALLLGVLAALYVLSVLCSFIFG